MKTLDEVIKAYEICLNFNEMSCRDCPYTEFDAEGKWACSLCGDCTEDALHYLKEYRDDKDEIDSTRLAYLDILTDYVALKNYWAEQQENKPLDWGELRQMTGKPIWVETNLFRSCWYLVSEFGKKSMMLYGRYGESIILWDEDMGKLWQAYRKERK